MTGEKHPVAFAGGSEHAPAMSRIVTVLTIGLIGCEAASTPAPQAPAARTAIAEPRATAELDAKYVAAMRTAAQDYKAWGRVDDYPRLAPAPCAAAAAGDPRPSHVRLSMADTGPHGKKLYYLWASDRYGYLAANNFAVGFTIVKESFLAVPGDAKPGAASDGAITTLQTDHGERLSLGARKDLFVMTKVAASAADGTDAGWVYGTVAVDGTVTSAGRVASCMSCHDSDASHERLFGLAPTPKP